MSRKIEALKGSIRKWQAVANGSEADSSGWDCPCCQAFRHCVGCPIKDHTGQEHCYGTPYIAWENYIHQHDKGTRVFDKVSKNLAEEELNFLKRLCERLEVYEAEQKFGGTE